MSEIKNLKSKIIRLEMEIPKAQEVQYQAQLEMNIQLNKWHCGLEDTKHDFENAERKAMPLAFRTAGLRDELMAAKEKLKKLEAGK